MSHFYFPESAVFLSVICTLARDKIIVAWLVLPTAEPRVRDQTSSIRGHDQARYDSLAGQTTRLPSFKAAFKSLSTIMQIILLKSKVRSQPNILLALSGQPTNCIEDSAR
jgi:hypothetical protein